MLPHHLNVIIGLIPNNPNKEIEDVAIRYLRLHPTFMDEKRDIHQEMFDVLEKVVKLFLRTESTVILNNIHMTDELVKAKYFGESYLTRLILESDSNKNPERFWKIWNTYRYLVPELIASGCDEQLKKYTLDIIWNDDAKEWHSLRQKDLVFFDYLGEQCGGNHAIFEGIVKILTTIGRNYKTEGMKWISTAITKNPTMTLSNSSALTYLEFVMMPYVFGNKLLIRRTPELLKHVRIILNFMVEKSSVTGFVLRDMVS